MKRFFRRSKFLGAKTERERERDIHHTHRDIHLMQLHKIGIIFGHFNWNRVGFHFHTSLGQDKLDLCTRACCSLGRSCLVCWCLRKSPCTASTSLRNFYGRGRGQRTPDDCCRYGRLNL